MIKLKFNNRKDEIKYFMLIRTISEFFDVSVRFAECVNDLDDKDVGMYYKEDD